MTDGWKYLDDATGLSQWWITNDVNKTLNPFYVFVYFYLRILMFELAKNKTQNLVHICLYFYVWRLYMVKGWQSLYRLHLYRLLQYICIGCLWFFSSLYKFIIISTFVSVIIKDIVSAFLWNIRQLYRQ